MDHGDFFYTFFPVGACGMELYILGGVVMRNASAGPGECLRDRHGSVMLQVLG
jgi:hypothetical protein